MEPPLPPWLAPDYSQWEPIYWVPAQPWHPPPNTWVRVETVFVVGSLACGLLVFLWLLCRSGSSELHTNEGRFVAFDLLLGRVHFSDSWTEDYVFHLKNNHPFLGIFLCHPDHPYRKWRRLVVLLSTTLVSLILTALAKALMPKWQVWARFVTTTFLISLPIMIINAFLAWCSVFPARWEYFQTRGHKRHQLACLGPCLSKCSWVAFYAVSIGSVLHMIYLVSTGIQRSQNGHVKELNEFANSLPAAFGNLLLTWVLWPAWDIALPCSGFGPPCLSAKKSSWYRWQREEMRPLGTPDLGHEACSAFSDSSSDSFSQFSDEL